MSSRLAAGAGGVKLVLPMPPNRANARGHWTRRFRGQKAYRQRALLDIRVQHGPLPDHRDKATATLRGVRHRVTAKLYVWNKMDDDNAVSRLKWPLDALVAAGLLVDDKRPYCELTGIPEQVIDRKHPRVELMLEVV